MSNVDELDTFATARLDEREAAAKAASQAGQSWEGTAGAVFHAPRHAHPNSPLAVGQWGEMDEADVAHIALNDPAEVLADVAAKRAILKEHAPVYGICDRCVDPDDRADNLPWPCPTVRHLVSIWAAHPDYSEEWRPWLP